MIPNPIIPLLYEAMAHRGNAMREGGALVLLALLAPVSCGKAKGDSDGGSGGGGGGGGGGASNTITGPIDGITPAALLGNIGSTTVASVSLYARRIATGKEIFGPFQAGFGARQDNNLAALGCSTGYKLEGCHQLLKGMEEPASRWFENAPVVAKGSLSKGH